MELSEVQEILLQLLKQVGMEATGIITIMLLLKEDEESMWDLAGYLYYDKATENQVLNIWLRNYLLEHPQNQKGQQKKE